MYSTDLDIRILLYIDCSDVSLIRRFVKEETC